MCGIDFAAVNTDISVSLVAARSDTFGRQLLEGIGLKASSYWHARQVSRRRLLKGAAATSASVAIISACGGGDSSSAGSSAVTATANVPKAETAVAKKGGTLNLMWNVADAQMDPHTTTEHFAPELWRAASHGLLKQEAGTQNAVADLATKWEHPDSLTYVFHLDARAKWQNTAPVNGRAVTADDVVYSLKRISTPDASHPRASGFSQVESITVTDAATVTLKLKAPFVPILTPLSDKWTVIVPKEVVDKFGDLKRGDSIIGCGPFICQQAESSKGATLVRNPDYWNSQFPYLDKVVYTTILDADAQQAAYRSRQIDILAVPDLQIDSFKADDTVLYDFPQTWMNLSLIGGPNDRAPFNDERVRHAINLGVDRDAIISAAFPGAKYKTAGVFENEFWGLPADEIAKTPGYGKKTDAEVKDARDLISAAGAAGTEIVLNTTKAYSAYHSDRAEAMIPGLEKIGLKIKLNVMEYAAFKDVESKKQFQMTAATYAAYGDPDTPLYNQFHSTGTRNYWNFSDPTYDAMVTKQRQIDDLNARQQAIYEIQRYLLKGTPMAHDQWYHRTTVAVRKRVHNYLGMNGANSSTAGWFLPGMWVDA